MDLPLSILCAQAMVNAPKMAVNVKVIGEGRHVIFIRDQLVRVYLNRTSWLLIVSVRSPIKEVMIVRWYFATMTVQGRALVLKSQGSVHVMQCMQGQIAVS
jgi:hypothetical protein